MRQKECGACNEPMDTLHLYWDNLNKVYWARCTRCGQLIATKRIDATLICVKPPGDGVPIAALTAMKDKIVTLLKKGV